MKIVTHSVLVQLIIGTLISAFTPWGQAAQNFLWFTQYSVIGLFLVVGLQIKFEKLTTDIKLSATLVLLTTILPLIVFYYLAKYFGLGNLESFAFSIILVTTGTGVTVQTLSNQGMLHSVSGKFLTLVSALDDIPAACLMAFLLMNSASAPFEIVTITGWVIVLILSLIIFKMLVKENALPLHLAIVGLIFGISFSSVGEKFHVSIVIGGLISGMMISWMAKGKSEDISLTIEKLLKPFLPLYMVFIGMKLRPGILKDIDAVIFAVVFIFVAIISKWLCTYLLMRKNKTINAKIISWGMVPRGIPGFAFASAALSGGLISQDNFTLVTLVVCVTTWIGLFGLEIELKKEARRPLPKT